MRIVDGIEDIRIGVIAFLGAGTEFMENGALYHIVWVSWKGSTTDAGPMPASEVVVEEQPYYHIGV
jgi:hypothetical protein